MLRTYPTRKATSAPATGRLFYQFLLKNIKVPAAANHNIWKAGAQEQLEHPEQSAFRGDIPVGRSMKLKTLAGKPLETGAGPESEALYTFTGQEAFVLVSDLSEEARAELGIPENARGKDKIFNVNFKPYDELPELTRVSNELAVLSVAKSISSFLAGVEGKVNYSEHDIVRFLMAAVEDLSSPEMMHLLHGNHMAWATLAYIRESGNVAGDVSAEFHAQNPTDFYTKDLGTVLPAVFFVLASLGHDPMVAFKKIDTEIWGAKEAAMYMRKYMPQDEQLDS